MAESALRQQRQQCVERFSETLLPTARGLFRCVVFRDGDSLEHIAMVRGVVANGERVLCRVHSECLTSEVLGSVKCDCKAQLDAALDAVAEAECGVVVYLRQEGRGIGLGNKIRAYALQEFGLDTVDANRHLGFADDLRRYDVAAAILEHLHVRSVVLLTNNPNKIEGLVSNGIRVDERRSLVVGTNEHNHKYLIAKRERMGHWLDEIAANETPTAPVARARNHPTSRRTT
ncbi:MAG: GTP cyclohydrolase II [Deltaproteobacteria bacterium]|nr:GTP cyclohydrolase II [Deltaproteobacteria bacterium]